MVYESLTVVIPAYNEASIIGGNLYKLNSYLGSFLNRYEIIVVDDGSTDKTRHQVLNAMRDIKTLKLIRHQSNVGKGYAVQTGIRSRMYATVLVLDADLSVFPEKSSLLKSLGLNGDFLVNGTRRQLVKQPLYRLIMGKIWQFCVWALFGVFWDTQCPYKVMRLPSTLYDKLKIEGFAYDVELIYWVKQADIPIHLEPVTYCNDKNSSVTLKKTMRMAVDLIGLRFN